MVGLLIGAAIVGLCASCSSGSGPDVEVVVDDARFPATLAPLPDGGFRYGELDTGRVREVTAEGTVEPEAVAEVAVGTGGERGLIGPAADDDDRTFATWTDEGGRIVVGQVAPGPTRLIWQGPESAERANGGTLAFAPDGALVLAVGDLLNAELTADPEAPNGKLLRLDPDGPPDQDFEVISSGWNNPYAFTFTPSGAIWVADNVGGSGSERLARGDVDGRPTSVTELEGDRAPAGLAATSDEELLVCGFVSTDLERITIEDVRAEITGDPLVEDCNLRVAVLADGSVLYSDDETIRRFDED